MLDINIKDAITLLVQNGYDISDSEKCKRICKLADQEYTVFVSCPPYLSRTFTNIDDATTLFNLL